MIQALKAGQRLEPIVYYCNIRKGRFKRMVVINDELEIRRALCGVEFIRKALGGNDVKTLDNTYLLVKSINGRATGHGTTSSLTALLFGPEHARARRLDPSNLWDFTREAYSIEKKSVQLEEQGV